MAISIEILEERLRNVIKDIEDFKKDEADEGKYLKGLIEKLFIETKYNLKSINEIKIDTEKAISDFQLKVEQKVSKINLKMALLATCSAGLSGFLTKIIGG